jgi:hypothetical protein
LQAIQIENFHDKGGNHTLQLLREKEAFLGDRGYGIVAKFGFDYLWKKGVSTNRTAFGL